MDQKLFDRQVRKLSATVGSGLEVGRAPVKVTKFQQASPVLINKVKREPRLALRRTNVKRQAGLP